MPGERPFELQLEELKTRIKEMVTVTISDLSSEFLLMPTGPSFVRYSDFQSAYEVLKRNSGGFTALTFQTVRDALLENSMVLGVLRSVLGMTAPEWAELARVELGSDITQGAARGIDKECRAIDYYRNLTRRNSATKTIERIDSLILVAVQYIDKGAPPEQDGVLHRRQGLPPEEGRHARPLVALGRQGLHRRDPRPSYHKHSHTRVCEQQSIVESHSPVRTLIMLRKSNRRLIP